MNDHRPSTIDNQQSLDRDPKFRKALIIGIAVWVFLMFMTLAIVIAIDWH
jgi:hypothetical protein